MSSTTASTLSANGSVPLKNFQDLYVSSLAHRTSLIKEQLESGLYLLKRCGAYLRKVGTTRKMNALEIIKFSDHEVEKKERATKDKMVAHFNAYQQVQHVHTQLAHTELKFASDILDRVAEPLLSWHKGAEARLKKNIASEEKLENNMALLRTRLKTERASCIKMWTELQQAYKEWEKVKTDPKKAEKAEKNFIAKRQKTEKAFAAFEQRVKEGNTEQRNYWKTDLPQIIQSYELLEIERMNEMSMRLEELEKLQAEFNAPLPGLLNLVKTSVAAIDTQKELRSFVDDTVKQVGTPQAPPPFVDGLPAPSEHFFEHFSCHLDSTGASATLLRDVMSQEVTTLCSVREAQQTAAAAKEMGLDISTEIKRSTSANDSSSSSSSSSSSASTSSNDPYGRLNDPPVTFVKALYDFTTDDPDDLSFTINTIIRVTLKGEDDELAAEVERGEASEPRWWRGVRLEHVGVSREGTFPNNYVKEVALDRDMTLRMLMEMPSGVNVFTQFMQQEYAIENVKFWLDVENFRKKAALYLDENGQITDEGKQVLLPDAQNIAQEYIGTSAPSQVNISSSTLNATQTEINKLPESLSLTMFDEASTEIMKMMTNDSFARFKKTDLMEKYLSSAH